MKIVSNNFKNKVNQFGRQLDTYITYGNQELNRDNIYNINPNFHTNIMETLMKSVIIEADTLIPVGTRINVMSGVKVSDNVVLNYRDNYEYINYGYYTVKEYEKDENTNHYIMKCYDDMMKTMVDYDLTVTYPITVKNLLSAICTHFSFTLNTQTFVNDDVQITTNVFSNINYTYRDVLDELAIATCSTIEIENNVMYIKYPTNTSLTINEDTLNDKNVSISKKYGPVNRLVIARIGGADSKVEQNSTSITNDGLTELKIDDKQIFSTEANRNNLMTEMWNYINGFQYYICNLDTQGFMYVEALDGFSVSIGNATYPTIAFNDETNVSDGLNEEIYQEEPIISEDNYKYNTTTDKLLKDAYIEVDKANGQISIVARDKVGKNEIIASINATPETITINANKVGITANDVLNILAGNTINLTSKNIVIDSTNFKVTAAGALTCSNANITGGSIKLQGANKEDNSKFSVYRTIDGIDYEASIAPGEMIINTNNSRIMTYNYDFQTGFDIYFNDSLLQPNNFAHAILSGYNYQTPGSSCSIEIGAITSQCDGTWFIGQDFIYFQLSGPNGRTKLTDSGIIAGNIDCGKATLTSSWSTVYFNKTFKNPPVVVLTPDTSTGGVIAGKVMSVTTTQFSATIGGSISGNHTFNWIAIDGSIS